MRSWIALVFTSCIATFMLSACFHKSANPIDPYEPTNRKIHQFNMAFDATFLKPTAIFYKAILPPFVRTGINNAYNNLGTIPTIVNDVLQADWRCAIKDSWRFFINSTFGIGGVLDMAGPHFALPPHYNDLGLTFAKWGNKTSPYIVIPFLGPSTIRDGAGMLVDYTVWSPYAYIGNGPAIWALAGLRYVDLRSQLLETEKILQEALDKYAFIRDAYLQRRQYLIQGAAEPSSSSIEESGSDYIEES